MAFPAFELWQAPWEKKGEEFDAETAKKFIYNLQKEADTAKGTRATERQADKDRISELETKVQQFEEKDLTEVERLRKEIERLKAPAEGPKGNDDLDRARLEIALDKGLTLQQSKRLAGTTREELEADADAYKAEVSGEQEQDGGEGRDRNELLDLDAENGGGEMPSNRPQQNRRLVGGYGSGAGGGETLDPSKMAEAIGRY
ncbi:MAG TPA: hypothetical protein VK034_27160 [Enhygromyxa sp.]|nr:hypothetical protein [Enhygromyxa sp.]